VFTDPELVLRVREPSPRLDALLAAEGATAAAYITAATRAASKRPTRRTRAPAPRSTSCWRALGTALRGEARDPRTGAPRASVLVIGIYRDNAVTLARIFGQNAICSSRRARRRSW